MSEPVIRARDVGMRHGRAEMPRGADRATTAGVPEGCGP
ncbi:hypothetical protein SAMN06265355_106457 [Actinomadura mexicana]|uniref:Uncharacterized protein n=1 Tax=Actinomadura mexicana TaxID=134959 RepID=A0A238Z4M1_9ACTN|nr:hypothetical protein SAMN06265355_106457 [Actinomadura mexicana]